MFKTIFGKQFFAYVCLLTVSLTILCVVLISFYSDHIVNNKSRMLEEQAKRITEICKQAYAPNLDAFLYNMKLNQISNELQIFKDYLDTSCFLTDTGFVIKVGTTNIFSEIEGKIPAKSILDKVKKGFPITERGSLGGLLPNDSLTVCYPVTIGGSVKAIVFVSSSTKDINNDISSIYKITFWCIFATAVVSYLFMYITSKTISRPIKQISEAAKIIAAGNFDKRIEYRANDEIGQLSASFNYMAESLNNQENKRREFIGNISHDLRSPLTSMKGFLQAIIDGTVPPEKHNRYLNIVLEESDRLSKLANDLLDLNKSEKLDLKPFISIFDLNELIRSTVIMFEHKIRAKHIEIEVMFAEEQCNVSADYEKIKRVLYNLTDNAVKFTPDNGEISIETTVKDGKVYTSVKDTGIGLSVEDQKKVFDRFYKVDTSRGADTSGSGLGLAIVKEFIRAHDETVTVTGETNKGCTFTFSLPLAEIIS